MLEINGIYFPSTSNSRQIAKKWINSNGKRYQQPFLMKSQSHQTILNELTALYIRECAINSLKPQFEGETTIIALLGKRPGRWDSHNFAKSIGDWIQQMSIIEDDSKAEILCFKRDDYSNEGGDLILIQSKGQVYDTTDKFIKSMFSIAVGKQE